MAKCDEVRNMMSLYIDNLLNGSKRKEFEEHIKVCSACEREFEEMKQVVRLCKNISDEELPAGFKEGLHDRLVKEKEGLLEKEKSARLKNRYVRVLSSVAACVLVLVFIRGMYGVMVPGMGSRTAPQTSKAEIAENKAAARGEADKPAMNGNYGEAEKKASQENPAVKKESDKRDDLKPEISGRIETGGSSGAKVREKSSEVTLAETEKTKKVSDDKGESVVIRSQNPEAELENIKKYVIALGGKFNEFNESQSSQPEEGVSLKVLENENGVGTEVKIPASEYSPFVEWLKEKYSDRIEFAASEARNEGEAGESGSGYILVKISVQRIK